MREASWIKSCDPGELQVVLGEYSVLVRRFTDWLSFAVCRAPSNEVRQLLLPNLLDECGEYGVAPSHLSLLQSLLNSCGVDELPEGNPFTLSVEAWFFNALKSGDYLRGLVILGPGTESISWQFLDPLQQAVVRCFGRENTDLRYFEVHRPEVEDKHAQDLNRAIHLAAKGRDVTDEELAVWAREAHGMFRSFWSQLERRVRSVDSL